MNDNDKVQCLICKKWFATIASSHLSSQHGLTTTQYWKKFPGAAVVSKAYSKRNCKARAKSVANRSPEKQAEVSRNCSEAKKATFDAYTPKQWKALGKRLSKTMRDYVDGMTPKQREAYGKLKTAQMTGPGTRVNGLRACKANSTEEEWEAHCKNLSEKAIARFERMSESELKEFTSASRKCGGTSKPEKRLVKKLKKLGLQVKAGYKLDRFLVDAFLPDDGIVVELYGDYWHTNPDRYEADYVHPVSGMVAKDIWRRDRKRVRKIEKLGYKVVIVWEHEMKTLRSSDLKRKLYGNTEPSRARK